jgi:hypothetical protein
MFPPPASAGELELKPEGWDWGLEPVLDLDLASAPESGLGLMPELDWAPGLAAPDEGS